MSETCSVCEATFGSPGELLAHQKKHPVVGSTSAEAVPTMPARSSEEPKPPLACAFCGAVYYEGTPLARHMRVTHGFGPPVEVPA